MADRYMMTLYFLSQDAVCGLLEGNEALETIDRIDDALDNKYTHNGSVMVNT